MPVFNYFCTKKEKSLLRAFYHPVNEQKNIDILKFLV